MSTSGCSEFTIFFSPIATSQGYRLLNAPAETALTNRQFWGMCVRMSASDLHPDADIVHSRADGNHCQRLEEKPRWGKFCRRDSPNRTTRCSASRGATRHIGPALTTNRGTLSANPRMDPQPRRPALGQPGHRMIRRRASSQLAAPWLHRPAPPGGPSLFGVVPAGTGFTAGGALQLVPVDHDPSFF
jgi:hypothetical protein